MNVAALKRKDDDQIVLGNIETDEEWTRIKEVLRELAKNEAE